MQEPELLRALCALPGACSWLCLLDRGESSAGNGVPQCMGTMPVWRREGARGVRAFYWVQRLTRGAGPWGPAQVENRGIVPGPKQLPQIPGQRRQLREVIWSCWPAVSAPSPHAPDVPFTVICAPVQACGQATWLVMRLQAETMAGVADSASAGHQQTCFENTQGIFVRTKACMTIFQDSGFRYNSSKVGWAAWLKARMVCCCVP